MCTQVKKTAQKALATISVANPSLNGTGSITNLVTAAASGSQISSITIKATGNTTQGMVRFFNKIGPNYYLWREINIPAVTQTSVVPAFQTTLNETISLSPGQVLAVSTQNAETFNIYANCIQWDNCNCSEDCTCGEQQMVASTGLVNIATANSNLNGTGVINTIITSPVGALLGGTEIPIIGIKATASTSEGMVRIFIDDAGTKYLISEVPIPASTQTSVKPAYRTYGFISLILAPGLALCASTEIADSFNINVFGQNITNCPCPQ